jgi:hypothetical protein
MSSLYCAFMYFFGLCLCYKKYCILKLSCYRHAGTKGESIVAPAHS